MKNDQKRSRSRFHSAAAAAILIGVLLAASSFSACGSSKNSASYNGTGSAATEAAYDGDYGTPSYAAADDVAEEAAWDEDWEAETADAIDSDMPADGDETSEKEYKNLDKIVYSCYVDLQTLEYDKSVSALKAAIKSSGGIIQSETERDNDYNWYYSEDGSRSANNRALDMTVRIPSDKYDAFVASLEDYGKVLSKTQNADNISKTYNDTSTYISSLETEQKRLLEMMDKAETIEDMMAVEERLTEVQRQLNQHKTTLEAMDMDLAYSTVTLNLQEVQKIANDPVPSDSFGTRVKKAFHNAWTAFAEFWEDFLFAMIYLLPAILVIGFIIWLVLFLTRKKRRARKERKAADRAMYEDLRRRAQEAQMNSVSSNPDKKE
ncbi:MAG: DUF4349 domain-containing protein [Eubacterium sp.]|nr:DUF4349 domain-containing protein [Eubacterium sp.]